MRISRRLRGGGAAPGRSTPGCCAAALPDANFVDGHAAGCVGVDERSDPVVGAATRARASRLATVVSSVSEDILARPPGIIIICRSHCCGSSPTSTPLLLYFTTPEVRSRGCRLPPEMDALLMVPVIGSSRSSSTVGSSVTGPSQWLARRMRSRVRKRACMEWARACSCTRARLARLSGSKARSSPVSERTILSRSRCA